MKKVLIILLGILLGLAVLGAAGVILFRIFVTNQITDRGGMENPDAGAEQVLDGDGTYVENGVLLERIVGVWKSADGCWQMTLGEQCSIRITLDGEAALEDVLEFSYLQPEETRSTELRLQSGNDTLSRTDGSAVNEILAIWHEPMQDDCHGKICMELTDAEGKRENIEFRKTDLQ